MKHGLLLVNLGTPSAATEVAIKHYLTEFLHDRHVVDLSPLIWYPILHGIVLPKRIPYITKHYQKIWLGDKSPLLHYSQLLQQKLHNRLANVSNKPNTSTVQCELAMTYGQPSLQAALDKLQSCDQITVLPLFPHYSTTTTQAVFDQLQKIIAIGQHTPKIDYIYDYADHPSYIHALYLQINAAITAQGRPDTLLLSYHGIPVKYITKRSDPYAKRCELTTQLLIQKLRAENIDVPIKMAYQSKFGKGEWTSPNTSHVLQQLAQEGINNVQVICPGFSADCLETIYEIDEENRDIFIAAGGKDLYYIPALNDSDWHVDLLLELFNDHHK